MHSHKAILLTGLILISLLMTPVLADTFFDTFNSDTSGSYNGNKTDFQWNTTNSVLSTGAASASNRQIYYNSTAYSYGIYTYDFTNLVVGTGVLNEHYFIFGSDTKQSLMGGALTSGNKYYINVRVGTGQAVSFRLFSIVAGTSTQLDTKNKFLNVTQPYRISINWSPGVLITSINGTVVNTSYDSSITSGYWGIMTATSSTYVNLTNLDFVQINETAKANFTVAISGLNASFAQDGENHADPGISYLWQISDGGSSDCEDFDYTFGSAGNYTVNLTVSGIWGSNLSSDQWVNVTSGIVPVASFTANATAGILPLGVAFTDTSTNTPTSWNWSFGDGNWSNGTSSTAEHLYEGLGTFNAYLIASNAAGSNQSSNVTITVNAPGLPTPTTTAGQRAETTALWAVVQLLFIIVATIVWLFGMLAIAKSDDSLNHKITEMFVATMILALLIFMV